MKAKRVPPECVFEATLEERLGRVAIDQGEPASVRKLGHGLTDQSRRRSPHRRRSLPPQPFSGTAHFIEEPDLRPRLGRLAERPVRAGSLRSPCAGSGFRAILCVRKPRSGFRASTSRLRSRLAPLSPTRPAPRNLLLALSSLRAAAPIPTLWARRGSPVEVAAELVELGWLDAVDVVGFGEVAGADLVAVALAPHRPSSRGCRRSA